MHEQLPLSEKVYFRSQILERHSIGKYWNIPGVPVLSVNVIFTFFRTCWWHPEANNYTGMPKWSSIVQYLCAGTYLRLEVHFPPFLICMRTQDLGFANLMMGKT